jgi:hypothetical protein
MFTTTFIILSFGARRLWQPKLDTVDIRIYSSLFHRKRLFAEVLQHAFEKFLGNTLKCICHKRSRKSRGLYTVKKNLTFCSEGAKAVADVKRT